MKDADQLLKLIKSRRSVRSFSDGSVPDGDIEKMLEAARWAPSGSNLQNWQFIVIRSKEIKAKMVHAVISKVETVVEKIPSASAREKFLSYSDYYQFFSKAPVVVAVVKTPYDSLASRIIERYKITDVRHVSYAAMQGVAAAIQNLLLMVHALGYGACWMTGPLIAKKEIEQLLDINDGDELSAIIPIGKPVQMPQSRSRKESSENVSFL